MLTWTILVIVLILWCTVGLALFLILIDAGAMPTKRSRKSIMIVAASGPLVWVVIPAAEALLYLMKCVDQLVEWVKK